MNPFSLAGRVALVTGASRGLGFAMARALAENGATVIVNARNGGFIDRYRAAEPALAYFGRATGTARERAA